MQFQPLQKLIKNTSFQGRYSPAASIVSKAATIRTTSQKESKDKKNREKLLARPSSEFSLANQSDMELDYYDYNVVNAGAAPGSYLGMDPAYLVWIPPLDDGNIIDELDGEKTPVEPFYEEILPRYKSLDAGSNAETPSDDRPPEPPPKNRASTSFDSSAENISICTDKDHDTEKETAVVKSPSDLQEYYELDDIKFADDDSTNESDSNCKTNKIKMKLFNKNNSRRNDNKIGI